LLYYVNSDNDFWAGGANSFAGAKYVGMKVPVTVGNTKLTQLGPGCIM